MSFLFLSSTPKTHQIHGINTIESLYVLSKYLNQYGTQCLTYTGDKTSLDYLELKTFFKNLFGQENQEQVTSLDITKYSGVKQTIIALDNIKFTKYPSGEDAFIGDQSWPGQMLYNEKVESILNVSKISGVQLLANLSLKIKYLRQYLTQILNMDPSKNLDDYDKMVVLCKTLFSSSTLYSSTINQGSGIKQILYALDRYEIGDEETLGNNVWPEA